MGLTMRDPFFGTNDPIEALVAVVDVGLQEPAFAGDLPTDAGLDVLISLAFGQTTNVSRRKRTKARTRTLTIRVSIDNISLGSTRLRVGGLEGKEQRSPGCKECTGLPWQAIALPRS